MQEIFIKKEVVIEQKVEKEITKEPIEKFIQETWQIEIPIINLKAQIAEGTTEEIMNQYVGHFINTSILNGNIGLAAHNRGYSVNYFQNIKQLKIGDEIIYTFNNNVKTYIVNSVNIISEYDWSYLENTNDNRITLITCVEDEPSYRRCIQAIEKTI